jgi:adenylate cyclase
MSEQSRQLAAIMFTDIVGYTALMQENEEKAVALIKHYNAALNETVSLHGGKVLNYYGDGSLCTFPSATEAINCAMDMQKGLQSDPVVPLRIGLHIGEVFFEDGKSLGDGVNVASRIQSLGQANTILFSKEIFDKIRNHPELKATSLGYFDFKNVDEPVEVFALANEGLNVPKREQMSGKLKHDLSKKKKAVRRNFTIGVSLLILLIAGIFLYPKYFSKQNTTIEKSIAIIPFRNVSNDSQQEYFAEGMMDEVLNHLFKIGGLNVISRNSSMAYKDSKKTSKEIANELGVGNLLTGSVQKDGDHIRIIVQLINGKTDQYLWMETYDREFKDVFYVQSEIAQQIAAALKVKIDPGVKERIEKKPTENTEAYNLYLQAIDPNAPIDLNNPFRKRMSLLEAAIKLDTTFAEAYAELAIYWLYLGSHLGNLSSQDVLRNAEPLLQKALRLNPNLASTHLYVASMHLWYKWDFETVQNEYQKVLQLNPSNPELARGFEDFLLAMGRFGEALNISTGAFTKDSTSLDNRMSLALVYYYNNKSEEALQIIKPAASLFEKDDWFMINYIKINLYTGEYKNVILSFEKYKALYGSNLYPIVLGYAAIAYYKTGQKDSTEKFLFEIKAKSEKSPVGSPSYFIATIYTAMGKKDEAIKWLQKAYTDHEVEMFWLKVEPLFSSLHSDPRFKELLKKIGFE